jgi:hypothetical protein
MVFEEIIHLLINRTKEGIYLDDNCISFGDYVFIFKDIEDISREIGSIHSSALCMIGSTRSLVKNIGQDTVIRLDVREPRLSDLLLVGAVNTLAPFLRFGGDELFFEVGLIIKTPKNKIFPASLYWAQGGLAIGCWQEEILGDFIELKKDSHSFKSIYTKFSNLEKEELAEAFEFILNKVPISDFAGEYWTENGGIRMGVMSGSPFIEDIPIDEDTNFAINYYSGELMDIMHNCATPEELEKFNTLTRIKRNADYKNNILLKFNAYLIKKCFDDLILFTAKTKSRYAFQALGLFLMETGINIPNDIKKLILKNSHWKDESLKYEDRKEKSRRREELIDFITKLLDYREGNYITLPNF